MPDENPFKLLVCFLAHLFQKASKIKSKFSCSFIKVPYSVVSKIVDKIS